MSTALSPAARRVPGRLRRLDPSLALALVPLALLLIVGWELRWVNEDGFIYFRVVDHLLAGEGPVFNAGERVEAYTSPAWLALLAVLRGALSPFGLEGVSVVLGVVLSTTGLLAACVAALRLGDLLRGGENRGLALPLGAVVIAATPAFWGFITSGLETSLVFAWLGGTFLALVSIARVPLGRLSAGVRAEAATSDGPERRAPTSAAPRAPTPPAPTLGLAFLIGLGPLVRPDLAPFSAAFLAVLVALAGPAGRRRIAAILAAAAAVPLAYQVFRMGYFAGLVPSTALAKEAGLPFWTRGIGYLGNFVLPYALPLPLAVLAWLGWRTAAPAWRAGRRIAVAVAAAPVAGALLQTLYVVRLGGDYMHGRMLLPALFGLLMPVAVVALPRRRAVAAAATALIVVWALVCALFLRTPSEFGPDAGRWQILDQRAKQRDTPAHPHPVTLADHDALALSQPSVGYAARAFARPGSTTLSLDARTGQRRTDEGRVVPVQVPLPLDLRADRSLRTGVVIFTGSIGRLGYAAGRDVRIADRLGLADPIAARLRVPPDRPDRAGHEKLLPAAWFVARFGDPSAVAGSRRFRSNPRIPAARDALACGQARELLAAVTQPLTASRFFSNIGAAIELHSLRLPADPLAARAQLCDGERAKGDARSGA